MTKIATPAASGFHMPAEWAPHERCWMAWPARADLWNGRERQAKDVCTLLSAAGHVGTNEARHAAPKTVSDTHTTEIFRWDNGKWFY